MKHNILLYIQNKHEPSGMNQVREMLLHNEGILYAGSTPSHDRLLWLEYDPGITSSRKIVGNLKSQGVDACMVGL